MPNKLPELYLYRLIPGAKQPSRWNIKSRYPVPVVPPAPPSDQNLDDDDLLAIDEPTAVTNPGKPTLTYSPGSNNIPTVISTSGNSKLTVSANLRINFPASNGGSKLRTYNIFMQVEGALRNQIVAQLLNVSIPSTHTANYIDIPNPLTNDAIDDMDIVSFTASVVNDLGETSELSDPISYLATLREFYPSKNY